MVVITENEEMQKEMDEIAKKTGKLGPAPTTPQTIAPTREVSASINSVGAGSQLLKEPNGLSSAAFKASFTRDFKDTTDSERSNFVSALCKVLDIPTPLNPFYFLDMQGKTLLYAGIEAAQLLAESKKLNVEIRKKFFDKETGLYTVEVRVQGPSGRFCDNEGIIYLGTITGKDRANAMMKTITKAQRRSILSYCGLSMTDDDDIQIGSYGTINTNPIAERAEQIIEHPPGVTDNEGRQARAQLFKFMLAGKDPLFKSVLEAKQYVNLHLGKEFEELTAEECIQLGSDLETEVEASGPSQDQRVNEPEGETHGLD